MIPILSPDQIRQADQYTIANEPITSIDLMERAAEAFVSRFKQLYPEPCIITIFCGIGNNGGDGLVVARLLIDLKYQVKVFCVGELQKATEDFKTNHERLSNHLMPVFLADSSDLLPINSEIIIDGLFGSGLSRPVTGFYAEVIQHMNNSGALICSIDMPSGLFSDTFTSDGEVVTADHTITFQIPKLVLFHPSSHQFVGEWHLVDIGLSKEFIAGESTSYYLTESSDIKLPKRSKFDHKGTAGRMLLAAGSKGKIGAAVLAARAAVRAGCGMLFIQAPRCGADILQISVPEAMILENQHDEVITTISPEQEINAIVLGPGVGKNAITKKALSDLILITQEPLVLDADALNILAEEPNLIEKLPRESILTPHPGEFLRLVGSWDNDFEKLDKLRSFCTKYRLNVVLKGAFSTVCDSSGAIHFNPTGNAGMATAGSGDVLTGIVGSFLTQGMNPAEALKSSVYIHGLAGDLALKEMGIHSLIASDIIENIPNAMILVDY